MQLEHKRGRFLQRQYLQYHVRELANHVFDVIFDGG